MSDALGSFAMHDASADLQALLNTVAQCLPGLEGHIALAQTHQLQCGKPGNQQRIAELQFFWQHAYPEAGRHYWSTRCWTLLIWQPIYLSLLAVHLTQSMPCLAQMAQTSHQGMVSGFTLPLHNPQRASEHTLITLAAEQLSALLERQLDEFNQVSTVYPKLARLLIADCARAALLLLQRQQNLDNTQLRHLEECWLSALGFSGRSPLIEIAGSDGRACLALGRNACCQHFRRADGIPCSGCPRLKPAERLERFQQELISQC